ncbi:MAG: electron transporter RnfB [Desulfobacteraceae bacterium 4572_89]|nr:MAG: electron transporter RnfB [Desulfobacteraceae bacterium 4572_89]
MIPALLFMLGIGAVCGIVLSLSSKVFYVYEDPRIARVENNLAGANCGGCGYAGCSAAADAIVSGKETPSLCIINSKDGVEAVSKIMGVDAGSAESPMSYNMCEGGNRAEDKYHYMGVSTCKAMAAAFGGKRVCEIGCIGLGDCVRACQFNALYMGPDGYPVVDDDQCVGCGACQKACPKDIIEVKTLSEKLMKFNQMNDPLAPCAQTCPAEINIPRYINQIKEGKYKEAVETIRMRNPLPLACGGGGPAGLSCAFFLRRLGHQVDIFEAMPKLGGIIRYGIPEYRLPKKVLDWEIQGILDLGIKSYTNVRFGRDFGLGSLMASGYGAVFLGIGAWEDYSLGIEGEDLDGCFKGIDFLSRTASGEKIKLGRTAAVVGGGNTAVDCARTLLRLGLEKVYMVYRRTRKEMPANEVEIVASEEEGIDFVFLAAPTRVVPNEEGKCGQLEYLKMKLGEPDASGRRRPEPIEGSETLLDVDMIISAIGQAPETSFKKQDPHARMGELELTRWNTIDNDPALLQSSIPYIFTGGDSATGPSLVVTAIGGGRRAARSIDCFLKGEPVEPVKDSLQDKRIKKSIFTSVDGIKKTPRAKMPEVPVEKRLDSMIEVDLVLPEDSALKEADRCLNCCRICYNPDSDFPMAN